MKLNKKNISTECERVYIMDRGVFEGVYLKAYKKIYGPPHQFLLRDITYHNSDGILEGKKFKGGMPLFISVKKENIIDNRK